MSYHLNEGTFNDSSWQKVAELIIKSKIEERVFKPVGDQFYRALLIDKNYMRYIAVGLFDKETNSPVIKLKQITN